MTDRITIPIDVVEAAAEALGNFVSDHGWSDSDMQAMDNLDSYIARHKAIRDEVAALKAERDAAMKDAERYRWLRDVWMDYKPAGYDGRNVGRFDLILDYPVDDLDAAIDAAIAKAEGGEA